MTPGVDFTRECEGEDTRLTRRWPRLGNTHRLGGLKRIRAVRCWHLVAMRSNQA